MSAESWMQLSSKVIKLTKDGSKVLLVLYFGRTLDSADSVSSAAFFFFCFFAAAAVRAARSAAETRTT